jgi:hypothetical protein
MRDIDVAHSDGLKNMYLIDGYNLLYQTDHETREELVSFLNLFLKNINKKGLILFDGYAPEDLSTRLLEVKFVGDADLEIIDIMKKNKQPTYLTLVSSDKNLIYEAKQNNIKYIKSEQFQFLIPDEVASDDEKPLPGNDSLEDYNYFRD